MSDKKDEFLSFEKALRELNMRSDELKKKVSEGDIRAYRDGDSMKFRREDIQAHVAQSEGETELSFADSLEDDTGMVTEQISEEDTLLAEEEPETKTVRRTTTVTRTATRAAPVAVSGAASKEPGWVTAVAVLSAIVMIWGFILSYSVSQESDPAGSMLTSAFAQKK